MILLLKQKRLYREIEIEKKCMGCNLQGCMSISISLSSGSPRDRVGTLVFINGPSPFQARAGIFRTSKALKLKREGYLPGTWVPRVFLGIVIPHLAGALWAQGFSYCNKGLDSLVALCCRLHLVIPMVPIGPFLITYGTPRAP